MTKYKRIILKISGEALSTDGVGIDNEAVTALAHQVKDVYDLGVELAIVIGGGNFWRGRMSQGILRANADSIGMLATVMNSIALADKLNSLGAETHVMTAVDMPKVAEPLNVPQAIRYLSTGKIVIFGGGCGEPFFSTDTAAVLRGCEIGAEIALFTKSVDGVYDKDPSIYPDAKAYDSITYNQILRDGLKAIDLTATAMASEHLLPIVVFSKDIPNSIIDVLNGKKIGTIIK